VKSVMFYHHETGILHRNHLVTSDDALVSKNTPADHEPIEVPDGRRFDHLSQRVDVAQLRGGEHATAAHLVDYQPPQPSADHEWNASTKRWQLSAAAQAAAAASAAARARKAELIESQHDLVRRAVLGDMDAKRQLTAIEDEILALKI